MRSAGTGVGRGRVFPRLAIRRGVLVWILLAFLAVTLVPTEASAECCCCEEDCGYCPGPMVKDALKGRFYNQWRRAINRARSTWRRENRYLRRAISAVSAAVTSSSQTSLSARQDLGQAKVDQFVASAFTEETAKVAAANTSIPARTNLICHTIALRQTETAMDQFADIVSRAVMSGFMAAGRGPGQNYDGPAYTAAYIRATCGVNPNDPPSGNPADQWPDPACEATDIPVGPANPTGAIFADSGQTLLTLDLEKSVLELPPLVLRTQDLPNGGSVDVRIPQARAGNLKQQLWIKARDACFNAAGPHPTPPWGRDLLSPDGQKKMAAQCLSDKMGFTKMCADVIGFITRPDCQNPDFAPLCEQAREACGVAAAHNITLPPRFENCAYGLSAYEMGEISAKLCSSSGRYTNVALQGGSLSSDKLQVICSMTQDKWAKRLAAKKKAFSLALEGLHEIRGCWDDLK